MSVARTLVALSFAAGLSACADSGGQTLLILNVAEPGEGCVVTPTETGTFLPAGRIDAAGVVAGGGVGYIATPSIKNLADSSNGTLTTERTVILQGARIDVTIHPHADGTDLVPADQLAALAAQHALAYTAPFAGSVGPDGDLVGIPFEAVPAAVVAAVGANLGAGETGLVTTAFSVFGKTTAGSGVESDPFEFPITVCNGCLYTDLGSCVGLPEGAYPGGGACNMYQDAPVACCTSGSGFQVCPAVPE